MITTLDDFYAQARFYVRLLDAFAKKHQIHFALQVDHISYKCDCKETFEHMRSLFEVEGNYIFQSFISKRRVAYIRLPRNIVSDSLGLLEFLELSEPKLGRSQKSCFDHIEAFTHERLSYEKVVAHLKSKVEVVVPKRAHHPTHDIELVPGFEARLSLGPLIDKIRREQMN
jgi:predicted metalloenzyme YecM